MNEGFALVDLAMHCAIRGVANNTPENPIEGECWLVDSSAEGAWMGHEGQIAGFQSGNWLFVTPSNGFRLFDLSTKQSMHFCDGWRIAAEPPHPSGGSVIDVEARAAIEALMRVLRDAGILAAA